MNKADYRYCFPSPSKYSTSIAQERIRNSWLAPGSGSCDDFSLVLKLPLIVQYPIVSELDSGAGELLKSTILWLVKIMLKIQSRAGVRYW